MRTASVKRRLRAMALGVAVSAAIVGGACGGEDDSNVSQEEFVKQVNALCTAEHEKVDALFTDFPEEPTPDQIQRLIDGFTPILREYRDDVKDVGAPEGKADEYERYTERLDDIVARYEAAAGDAEAAQALFNEDDTSLGEMEAELGLDVCASR